MAKKSKASDKAKDDALFEKFKEKFYTLFLSVDYEPTEHGYPFDYEPREKRYLVDIDERKLRKLFDNHLRRSDYPSLNELRELITFNERGERLRFGTDSHPQLRDRFDDDLEESFQKSLELSRFDVGQTKPRMTEEDQTSSVRKQEPLAVEKPEFVLHDPENFTSFTFDGKEYRVGPRQGKAIKLLHEEGKKGSPDVSLERILEVMGRPKSSKVKDSFRRTGLWNTLLVRKKNTTRRLSIFS